MILLPHDISDQELIAFIDGWAALMEKEDYDAAFAYTDQVSEMKWTPELYKRIIKSYDECNDDQKVTVEGKSTDITQRKQVDRWEPNSLNEIGEIWYDLNINGFVSDLTATFRLVKEKDGIRVELNDIHVM